MARTRPLASASSLAAVEYGADPRSFPELGQGKGSDLGVGPQLRFAPARRERQEIALAPPVAQGGVDEGQQMMGSLPFEARRQRDCGRGDGAVLAGEPALARQILRQDIGLDLTLIALGDGAVETIAQRPG